MYSLKSVIPRPWGVEVSCQVGPMRVITFKVDEDLLERLDSYAKMKGLPRSEVIRQAIEYYLTHHAEKRKIPYKVVKLYT